MSLKKPRHNHGVFMETVGLDSSTWGPEHWPVSAGWWRPAPKVHVLCIPSSPFLRTPETNLRSTRNPSLPTNPQARVSHEGRGQERSPASPLFVGPKVSDGLMAGKHSPSWSDSLHLWKQTVNRLPCWTLQGSSSLGFLCPEFCTFLPPFLPYLPSFSPSSLLSFHRNGKASTKCLCLTFLR